MRIALTGSHGTGKTTLARAIAEKFDLPLITEVARFVARQFGITHSNQVKKGDLVLKACFQDAVWGYQLGVEESLDQFVADRSILDVVAYSRYYGLGGRMWKSYEDGAIVYASDYYDLLIYLPIHFELQDDSFRLMEGQKEVDELIRSLFERIEGQLFATRRIVLENGIQFIPIRKSQTAHRVIEFLCEWGR